MVHLPRNRWLWAARFLVVSVPCLGAFIMLALIGRGVLPSLILEHQDLEPSWNPAGTQLVFVCYRHERVRPIEIGDPYYGPYTDPMGLHLEEICTADIDGQNRRQLTDNHVIDSAPSWSPDGTRIVFVSARDATRGSDIFVMNRDGSNVTRLTHFNTRFSGPRWSPDGRAIAFVRDLAGDLYVMAADGSQITRLTTMGGILDFSWSPSSEFIMFDGGVVSNKEIYIVNVGTGSIVPLTDNAIHDSSPVWSPDGHYALLQSDREIVTVNIQSLEITEISSGTWPSWGARWSPDGELISFVEDESGSQTLSISNLATGTYESYPGFQGIDPPLWSPDSKYLIYRRMEDRNGDGFTESKLWILRVEDGTEWTVTRE